MKKRTWKTGKTLKRQDMIRDIFKDRINVILGLTKLEVISKFKGVALSKVLNWNDKKIDSVWDEVSRVRRMLRKEMILAIVSKQMPRGVTLNDPINGFGSRTLDKTSHVFFRCSSMEDVWAEKAKLDKIAKGVFKSGEQIGDIVEIELKEKPVLIAMNQIARN